MPLHDSKRPGQIRVGNKRAISDHKPELDETVIDIDRGSQWPGSALANPYVIGRDGTRFVVLRKFRNDFDQQMRERKGSMYEGVVQIVSLLRQGEDVVLMCWCHPNPCHGHLIQAAVEKILNDQNQSADNLQRG